MNTKKPLSNTQIFLLVLGIVVILGLATVLLGPKTPVVDPVDTTINTPVQTATDTQVVPQNPSATSTSATTTSPGFPETGFDNN